MSFRTSRLSTRYNGSQVDLYVHTLDGYAGRMAGPIVSGSVRHADGCQHYIHTDYRADGMHTICEPVEGSPPCYDHAQTVMQPYDKHEDARSSYLFCAWVASGASAEGI